ncbi:hypothetical protein Tco_0386535 [Tanacetum coccineum]
MEQKKTNERMLKLAGDQKHLVIMEQKKADERMLKLRHIGMREVKEDASKVSELKKLARELLEDVRRRRRYIGELKKLKTNKDVIRMVELLQRMQRDDREKAAHLLLMANETMLKFGFDDSGSVGVFGRSYIRFVKFKGALVAVLDGRICWVDMDVVVNANMKDSLKVADMKTSDGVLTKFSVNKVWKELKNNEEQVDWWKRVIRLYPFHLAMISLYALCKMDRDMVIDIKDFNVVKCGPDGISFSLMKWLCGSAYKLGVNSVPLHDLEAASPPSGWNSHDNSFFHDNFTLLPSLQ